LFKVSNNDNNDEETIITIISLFSHFILSVFVINILTYNNSRHYLRAVVL